MQNKVFLSSTAKDLKRYREAAFSAISGPEYRCIRMEEFGARDRSARDFCRRKVGQCDLFVGIVGHLHGSSPPDSTKSFTELEFEAALEYDKPILMFLASDELEVPMHLIDEESKEDPEKLKRQKAFQQRVARYRVCSFFSSVDELSSLIRRAIRDWEGEQKKIDDTEPNLGSLVPYTCDRTDQEARSTCKNMRDVIDTSTGRMLFRLDHTAAVKTIEFSADGKTLRTVDVKDRTFTWDFRTGRRIR